MKAILLDLDGTLVDSRQDLTSAANAARTALGQAPLSLELVSSYVGDGLAKLLQRCFPDADAETLAKARSAFVDYYAVHCCDETRCYSGIIDSLEQLHADGYPLAVVTNKPIQFTEKIITGLKLEHLLPVLVGGDKEKKPDPTPLFQACRQLQVEPEQAMMCGDHHTDLLAGKAAGCTTVWCSWGIGHHDDAGFDLRCDDPAHLYQVLHG